MEHFGQVVKEVSFLCVFVNIVIYHSGKLCTIIMGSHSACNYGYYELKFGVYKERH